MGVVYNGKKAYIAAKYLPEGINIEDYDMDNVEDTLFIHNEQLEYSYAEAESRGISMKEYKQEEEAVDDSSKYDDLGSHLRSIASYTPRSDLSSMTQLLKDAYKTHPLHYPLINKAYVLKVMQDIGYVPVGIDDEGEHKRTTYKGKKKYWWVLPKKKG